MDDLKRHFAAAVGPALENLRKNYSKDQDCIDHLRDKSLPLEVRASRLQNWLKDYGVFQGIAETDQVIVAKHIVDRADKDTSLSKINNFKTLQSGYEILYTCIAEALPRNDATKKRREVTSLTSKALWCLSPGYVPILDAYAQRTLWILGRLYGVFPTKAYPKLSARYLEFADVWFQIGDKTKFRSLSNAAFKRIDWGAHAVDQDIAFTRGLDKVLWIMGQKRFADDVSAGLMVHSDVKKMRRSRS